MVYKTGAKEIAALEGQSITFMAKFNEREGSSCHIHMSLKGLDDTGFERFVAGLLACLRELTLFYAPNINSYKRFAAASFAPTAVAWGHDNRTCAVRVVGHGESRRLELRLPGADVNPYLALPRWSPPRCTGSTASSGSRSRSAATRTPPISRTCRRRCRRRASCSRPAT